MTGEERLHVVLDRLRGAHLSGGAYSARCPSRTHGKRNGDRHPSLRVSLSDDREVVLIFCNVGCALADILVAIGLTPEDLRPERTPAAPTSTLLRRHEYPDPHGHAIAVKVLRKTTRGRSWAWERPDGTRGLGGVKPGLYRRPEIDAALRAELSIWIAEGERDADTLAGLGLAATTAPYGAGRGKKWHDEWTEILCAATVVIVADRDEVGITFAREVASKLSGAGCRVSMLVPPAGFKDITEMIGAERGIGDLVPLTDDLDLSTPTMTRRYLDDGRPAFVMLPHYWWSEHDPHCCQLTLALADQYHDRVKGRVKGRNKLATLLRWDPKTVTTHLRHLEAAGEATVKPGHGRGQEIITLVSPYEPEHRDSGELRPTTGGKFPPLSKTAVGELRPTGLILVVSKNLLVQWKWKVKWRGMGMGMGMERWQQQ